MKQLSRRPLQIIALVLALQILLAWSGLPLIAQAQESSPFKISIIPAADYAVSGQPFTYTVVITNVSEAPVQYASINVDVPEGTKFIRTHYTDEKWYGGNSFADPEQEVKQVQLLSPEIIEAGEVFSFEMIVEVMANPNVEITIADYDATAIEDNVSTTGLPVQVAVRAPTPTPTPTVQPSPTSIPAATATSLPATPQAAIVATTVVANDIENSDTDATTMPAQESRTGSSIAVTISIVATLLFGFIVAGVLWFLRKR